VLMAPQAAEIKAQQHLGQQRANMICSQHRRIIEWFRPEGTLKDDLVPQLCHVQRHLPLDQVGQSPVQPDLEHVMSVCL